MSEPGEIPVAGAGHFAFNQSAAVLTHPKGAATLLIVDSWHPGRGLTHLQRDRRE